MVSRGWLDGIADLEFICLICKRSFWDNCKNVFDGEDGFWAGGEQRRRLGGSSWAIHEQYPQGYYTPTPPPPRQCTMRTL